MKFFFYNNIINYISNLKIFIKRNYIFIFNGYSANKVISYFNLIISIFFFIKDLKITSKQQSKSYMVLFVKKQMHGLNDKLIELLFCFWIIWLSTYFFFCHFVYTYYITLYIILMDTYLILNCIKKFKFIHPLIKEFSRKVLILIPILLLQLPLFGVIFFYRVNKFWINKVIIIFLLLIWLWLIIFLYLNNLFIIMLVAIILTYLLVFLIIFYYQSKKKFDGLLNIASSLNVYLNQYKVIISFIVSLFLFYLNNWPFPS